MITRRLRAANECSQAKLEEVGLFPVGGTPDEVTQMLRNITDDMTKLAKRIGIEPN